MNLEKVGNFIAELRKEKGLTQEKLGEQLGASGKTISKWERGVNAPDIALLNSLSTILGVDIKEILNGERKAEKNLSKKRKKLIIKIIIVIFLLLILLFPMLFTISNYNTVRIYNIESKTDKYFVSGFIMYNKERNLLLIHNIDLLDHNIGTELEDKVKNIIIGVHSGNKTIFSVSYDVASGEDLQTINSYLLNRTYYVDEVVKQEKNILSEGTDLNKLKLVIQYKNQQDKVKKITIPLTVSKEYSNNKLFGGV